MAPESRNPYHRPPGRGYNNRERRHDPYSSDRRNGTDSARYAPPPPPPPSYGVPPPPSYPPPNGKDSYRPPQGDFKFRSEKPPGLRDYPGEGYSSSYPPRGPQSDRYRPGDFRQRDRRGQRPPRGFHRNGRPGGFVGRPPNPYREPAFRPMMREGHVDGPTQDMYDTTEPGFTYRDLADLSDNEEAEMSMSDSDADDDQPRRKRTKTVGDDLADDQDGEAAEAAEAAPKWSNPDPYTVLPPVDSTQKKKDVVQLIRKARVQPNEGKPTAAPSAATDFIAFDSESEGDDDFTSNGPGRSETSAPASGAPAGPRSFLPPKPPTPKLTPGAPAPLPGDPSFLAQDSDSSDAPPPPPPTSTFSTRKRTHDDILKPSHVEPLSKGIKRKMLDQFFIDARWRVTAGVDPCPWTCQDYTLAEAGMLGSLHLEVRDFYDFVCPRQFEAKIRQDLVANLNSVVRHAFGDAQILAFGSFKSGLYLPNADMDLVFCSDSFVANGRPKYDSKKFIFKLKSILQNRRMILDDQFETITKARVPLLKYLDRLTGLKVDMSFENIGGVAAIQTFVQWSQQYRMMPVLVTLVKHLLTMHCLNEPANGGIGGFTVTCLVTSMLQLHPEVQAGNGFAHLGKLLMDFFRLYGKEFNHITTAIRMNPPGYVPKNKVNSIVYKSPDRLSIIDPNNPSNDISGGSSNIDTIRAVFSGAYDALEARMDELMESGVSSSRQHASILGCIIQGNYSQFTRQREFMSRLYEQQYGPIYD